MPSFNGNFWLAIVVLLTCQDFDVRELAISLAGRLSEKNPAYVVPALRRRLIQLLTYLEQRYDKLILSVMFCSTDIKFFCVYDSMDSKGKEESARLLGCLIRSCERLVLPYIAPIHKVGPFSLSVRGYKFVSDCIKSLEWPA